MKTRTYPQRHDDLLKENTRLLNLIKDLRDQVIDLKSQVKEYRAGSPRLLMEKQTAEVRKWAQDKEMVEACRQCAWLNVPDHHKYWVDARNDYVFPEGFPEGVTPETAIARSLGLDVYLGEPSEKTMAQVFGIERPEPESQHTFLHDMLEGNDG